jgi:hypothetical protein
MTVGVAGAPPTDTDARRQFGDRLQRLRDADEQGAGTVGRIPQSLLADFEVLAHEHRASQSRT